jgi:gamma-glutamylputrescine oxidase
MKHSYWENEQWFKDINFAIIGSGIVGINCALRLRENHPKAKIVIFEKGYIPSGASSKNAGFACFGSPSEILNDFNSMSEDEVFELIQKRIKGLEKLKKTCGVDVIDYQQLGSYEVFANSEQNLYEKCAENLPKLNQFLKPIFNEDCYSLKNDKIKDFGFSQIENMIFNKFEGQIDTGKMMNKLISLCFEKNIQIINGFEVKKFIDYQSFCELHTQENAIIKVDHLFIANNGFAKEILSDLDVLPARAQVLITKPIDNLKLKGTFHMNEGYYYFRNIGDRILLGGGRNLDFDNETTTKLEVTNIIQEKLNEILHQNIAPYVKNNIVDYSWAGIMGVGKIKKPIIKKVSNHVYCAVRMGGMGVALGSNTGVEMADLYHA